MSSAIPESIVCSVCGERPRSAGIKDGCCLHACPHCGHYWVWPIPVDPLEIYNYKYFFGGQKNCGYVDYDRDKLPMISTFQRYLDLIERWAPEQGNLLDVGAATGFFQELARRRGWSAFGVELSDAAAAFGRERGRNVVTGDLESSEFPDQFFDAVTLWDVVEHLPYPRSTLLKVSRLLKPNGILAINTPDVGSFLARLMGRHWHLVVPTEHLNLFHRKSLRLLLQQTGFAVLAEDTIGKRFSLQYVFQMMNHWTTMPVWTTIAESLRNRPAGQLGIPINLRDNMFVLARKTNQPVVT